jgi:hypothetical protein
LIKTCNKIKEEALKIKEELTAEEVEEEDNNKIIK